METSAPSTAVARASGLERGAGAAQADHLVRADVGLSAAAWSPRACRSQGRWPRVVAGVLLAGPMVCATSQAVNDWFDRHVDAINEPQPADPLGPHARPLGPLHRHRLDRAVAAGRHRCWAPGASAAARGRAWRWPGPTARRRSGSSATAGGATAAVAACYEGLPWFTGAAVMAGARPGWRDRHPGRASTASARTAS